LFPSLRPTPRQWPVAGRRELFAIARISTIYTTRRFDDHRRVVPVEWTLSVSTFRCRPARCPACSCICPVRAERAVPCMATGRGAL